MARILNADKVTTLGGVTVNEYLLTNHNPNNIDMPSVSMESKIIGVTVHNAGWITTAAGTTPAEQYTRATVNGNMKDVRVHFYVDDTCAWQNLPLELSGWHAADGGGDGNRKTISIECIMVGDNGDRDKKSEDNCARLAAELLRKYNLGIESLYTHTHWLNVKDGKKGTVDELNVMRNSYKMCPAFILPHWTEFKNKVAGYLNPVAPKPAPAEKKPLYRIRLTWENAKSQIGAYASLDNAKSACKVGYTVFDETGKAVFYKSCMKGTIITLNNTKLYVSATAKDGNQRSGTFYIYDGNEVNGRVRITTKLDYCGNTPAGHYVTGWVNKADI